MVLNSSTECSPPPPPAFSTDPQSELYMQAVEDYVTVNNLTADEKFIAQFWADNAGQTGTPPGHWIDIVRQISQRAPLNLGQSAEAFAPVSIAVSDAFIGCWRTKYTYDFIRPVTYIDDNIDPPERAANVQIRCAAYDQASSRGRRTTLLHLLPYLSGDRNYYLFAERRHFGARPDHR